MSELERSDLALFALAFCAGIMLGLIADALEHNARARDDLRRRVRDYDAALARLEADVDDLTVPPPA